MQPRSIHFYDKVVALTAWLHRSLRQIKLGGYWLRSPSKISAKTSPAAPLGGSAFHSFRFISMRHDPEDGTEIISSPFEYLINTINGFAVITGRALGPREAHR
jgi:hypothetical protein